MSQGCDFTGGQRTCRKPVPVYSDTFGWAQPSGVREVREETGLEVDIKDLIDVVDTIHRDDEGHVHMQYTLVDYWAEWISGELVAGTDAADARWVNPEDLPAYNLWDETLRIIDLSAKRVSARYLSSDIGRAPRKACM